MVDTGPGIPEDHQSRIFEQFHQVDSSNAKAKGGTGLGLAIAKQIVEMHGDRIWVESTLGNGSTFRMIPVIFKALHMRTARGRGETAMTEATINARRDSAAVIGFVAAIGATGGYFVPRSFGASIKATGNVTTAIMCFELFYLACAGITWFCYLRRSFLASRLPSLAEADA